MINNEKGHILPVTVIFSFFFIALLNHQINLYMIDQKFFDATEDLYVMENLMQITAKEVVLNTPTNTAASGKKEFPEGTVIYTVNPISLTSSKVTITCTSKSGGEFKAEFIYDYVIKKMINWIEVG
jgi:hypothetical protein